MRLHQNNYFFGIGSMTSKTRLKELIESLRDEVRELKTEIEVLKTLVTQTTAYVTPFTVTSQPMKDQAPPIWSPVEGTTTVPYVNRPIIDPKYNQINTNAVKGFENGAIINSTPCKSEQ